MNAQRVWILVNMSVQIHKDLSPVPVMMDTFSTPMVKRAMVS